MKRFLKRATVIVLMMVFVLSLVLSYNVQLNLKIRRKVFEMTHQFEQQISAPQTVFLNSKNVMYSAYNDVIAQLNAETGAHYFEALWLKSSNTTALYDEKTNKLIVEAPTLSMEIDSDGNTTLNGQPIKAKISYRQYEGNVFLPYESFFAVEGTDSIGFHMIQGSQTAFYSDYETYTEYMVSDKEPLFESSDALNEYNTMLKTYIPFISGMKVFDDVIVSGVAENENVFLYRQEDKPSFVITQNGEMGYIGSVDDNYLTEKSPQKYHERKAYYQEPITLVWEAVYSYNPNTDKIPPMKGVNVLSPTWYELSDASGTVSSKASKDYVDWAKAQGYAVWALITNEFDIEKTHTFLYDKAARDNLIQYMISEAKKFGYEGINIDFEHVYMADKDALTHFVNEFSKAARKENIILSIDVTIMGGSDNWSKCYDHEALGRLVDYLIVMTYDQHWASSPISGPVAAYDWVNQGVEKLISVMDSQKLIMGVPFYTRVWREYPSTEKPNTYVNKSAAIGMEAQQNLLDTNNPTLVWDDVKKVYYATYFEDQDQVKIWVENARSIGEKSKLVKMHNLGGIAAWRRGFETQDVWEAIYQGIRK